MAEHQARYTPVAHLFRTRKNVLGEQVFKASVSVIIAVFPCHSVIWVCTFIPFITGKYIQICTVQMNVMLFQAAEIPFHIVRCLCSAKKCLRSARPSLMSRYRAVCKHARIMLVIARCGQIIIPVLVMNPKHVSQFLHCVG